MASSGKRKTTFAKLARESKLRERRLEKQARKDARKRAAQAGQTPVSPDLAGDEPDRVGDDPDPVSEGN
jgi:hypothetical protein